MSLLKELSFLKFLELEAWGGLNKSNPESYGLSTESIAEFKSQIETRLVSISENLSKRKYTFAPTRAFVIPKDNGKFRPLQIPEIQDRVVLKGIAILLERVFREVLKKSTGYSFAYQKGLGVRDAVNKMKTYYDAGNKYILEADIINFFPTVNRQSLLGKLFEQLPDSSINNLITDGLSQRVGGLDQIDQQHHSLFDVENKTGIPQGNPLSPLFSNLYLSSFDLEMIANGFNLIRYADDFIVMCKDEAEANRAYLFSKTYLEDKLHLKVHELGTEAASKTRIINPAIDSFSFLSIAFDGQKLFPSRKSVDRFIANIDKVCNSESVSPDVFTFLMKLRFSVDGWVSTYFYTDLERYFEEIDTTINQQSLLALRRLNWPLTPRSLGKVKGAYRRKNEAGYYTDSGECLSNAQRRSSGIPFCKSILVARSGNKEKSTSSQQSGNANRVNNSKK